MTTLLRKIAALFRRGSMDRDVEEELRFHAEMKANDVGEAEARRAMGSTLVWRERSRDAWGFGFFDDLVRDLRYALRLFRQSPGFSCVAVGMLALGIGVNAMVFSIVNAVLFKGYFGVKDNQSLLYLTSFDGCCVSYPDFLDWRTQAQSFEGMELTHGVAAKVDTPGGSREVFNATEVTSGTFHLLDAKPVLGRDFTPADDEAGAQPVAMVQYEFWQQHFAGNPSVVGTTIRLNNALTRIIGVMPPHFVFPQKSDFWLPLVKTPAMMKRDNRETWMVVARMKPGITRIAARAEMQTIGRRLEAAYPDTNKGLIPNVFTYTEFLYGPGSTLLYGSLWGAVGFVLLIACANLANLLLGRAASRGREISLRMALGAGRGRIVRQVLLESLVIATAGGVLGYALAAWGLKTYVAAARQSNWMSWMSTDYRMDNQAVLYIIVVTLVTGLAFGLAPAMRLSGIDVNAKLKDGGRGASVGTGHHRLSQWLIAIEMGLAVVLLAGAGVMVRSFVKLSSADLGVDPNNVLTFNLDLEDRKSEERIVAFYDRLLTRLNAVPGVETTALAGSLPGDSDEQFLQAYEVDGETLNSKAPKAIGTVTISPKYFQAVRAKILAGRAFVQQDGAASTPVAIVNQLFADVNWPGRSPIGKRIRLTGRTATSEPDAAAQSALWMTVVGVASNISHDHRKLRFTPIVYIPYAQQRVRATSVIAKSRIPAEDLVSPFRAAIAEVEPNVTIWRLWPLTQVLRVQYWRQQFYGTLFAGFAAIALLLAAAGLYAVLAHSVGQRTQEIGVRMALGSSSRAVLALVFRQGMAPVGIGLAGGLTASLAVNRLVESQLSQVSPRDPLTLGASAAILLIAAALGCWIPARRALRVDPVVALRHE